jgi:ribosomal protein S18 acetylase RimI-like enzyme
MSVVVRRYEGNDLAAIKSLFTAYHLSLPIDISYQNYEDEFNALPGNYVGDKGGALFVAEKENSSSGCEAAGSTSREKTVLGCVALRRMDERTCELKRLFVTPQARGLRAGLALVNAAVQEAKRLQYACILLDTLPEMKSAIALYTSIGFVPVPKYYDTPILETVFFELRLAEVE